MNVFYEIPSLGNLVIDQVIFETYYPIIFTCMNEKKDLFLCVCCCANESGKKWLITKTKPQVLVDMLRDRITVRDAFLKYPDVQVTVIDSINKKEPIFDFENKSDWDAQSSTSLPDVGEYLEAEDGEFDEEIAYYLQLENSYFYAAAKEIYSRTADKIECHSFEEQADSWEMLLQDDMIYKQILSKVLEQMNLTENNSFPVGEEELLSLAA